MTDSANKWISEDKALRLSRRPYGSGHPSEGKLNPYWKYRIKVARSVPAQTGSTGEIDLDRAIRKGYSLLDDMRALNARGYSIDIVKFREIARQYVKDLENENRRDKEAVSDEKYAFHKRTVEKQLTPYFGDRNISKITSQSVTGFYRQRAQDKGYGGKPISRSHLSHELTVLRKVLNFALERGRINEIPDFPEFKAERHSYRDGLTKEQWDKLKTYLLNDFVAELNDRPTDQSLPKFYRQTFVDYFQLVIWTGLRKTEALKLRWSDLSFDDEYQSWKIDVRALEKGARKNKEGRKFKVSQRVVTLLQGRRKRADYTNDEDYIFAHPKMARAPLPGRNIGEVRTSFQKALDACGLLYDEQGNKRTPYIGRHTHAHLARRAGKRIDHIAFDIGNLTQTTERFYVRRNAGERLDEAVDVPSIVIAILLT